MCYAPTPVHGSPLTWELFRCGNQRRGQRYYVTLVTKTTANVEGVLPQDGGITSWQLVNAIFSVHTQLCTQSDGRGLAMIPCWRHLRRPQRWFGSHTCQALAIRAMAEVGIDISQHESKTLQRYLDQPWDNVITVCDEADANCLMFPGGQQRLHWSFPDPSKASGSEDEQLGGLSPGRTAHSTSNRCVCEGHDDIVMHAVLQEQTLDITYTSTLNVRRLIACLRCGP